MLTKGDEKMTLTMAPQGKHLIVQRISGKDEFRSRLAALGFVVGADCLVVSERGKHLITVIQNTRIAMEKCLGNLIQVVLK